MIIDSLAARLWFWVHLLIHSGKGNRAVQGAVMTSLKCRAVVELGKGQIDNDVGLTWASCYCLEKLENPSILAVRDNVVLTEILPVFSEGHTVLEERFSIPYLCPGFHC